MSDIFREVEEDVRRERYEQLWKKYGDYVIAAVALIVIAAAGYRLWLYYELRANRQASEAYTAAEQLLESNRADQAATAFAKLADAAPSGYAMVARLQNADALEAAGNSEEAIALYKKIMAGEDPLLADVARIRLGWVLVDSKPRLEMGTLLAPLTDPTSPWRFMAREILAYSDYRAGQFGAAQKEYEALAAETSAPIGVRQRSDAMATFLKAGGDASFGSVPPLVQPAEKTPTKKPAGKQGPAKK